MVTQLQTNINKINTGIEMLIESTNAIIEHRPIEYWYQKVKYIKLEITKNKGNNSVLQMSEFGFRDNNGNRYNFPSGTTITSNRTGNSEETIDKLIDNNTGTKYCTSSWSNSCTIIIDLGTNNTIDLATYCNYYYYTANDSAERDPVSWNLYASIDGQTYEKIDEKANLSITDNRISLAGIWTIDVQNI